MKRRQSSILGSCGAAAFGVGMSIRSNAANSADKANLLKTALTPFGAKRAGKADGSIPAWTDGITEPPAGGLSLRFARLPCPTRIHVDVGDGDQFV